MSASSDTRLRVENVSVCYGGLLALNDVSLEVRSNQLVGLIGPNGAGKTTLVDAITGYTRSSGSVYLDGADISTLPVHLRARRGLARTWQSGELFDALTVAESLAVAAFPGSWWPVPGRRTGSRKREDEIRHALDALGIGALADALPGELTQGQRKLVGMARALVARPAVVCLDEPAAGLDTNESMKLAAVLRELVAGGTSLLLIDHDMGLVLSVCDHIYVLDFGNLIAHGSPAEIRNDERVISAYLGRDAQEARGAALA